MGKWNLFTTLKLWFGGVCFNIFLWSIGKTTNEYLKEIYQQEKDLHLDKNCAINEETADDVSVGRCYIHVGDKFICSRHGYVRDVQRRYAETGKLTFESEHRRKNEQ